MLKFSFVKQGQSLKKLHNLIVFAALGCFLQPYYGSITKGIGCYGIFTKSTKKCTDSSKLPFSETGKDGRTEKSPGCKSNGEKDYESKGILHGTNILHKYFAFYTNILHGTLPKCKT